MSSDEFKVRFDILFNNAMSNKAPGLTEYEKSVFLTKAQDEILKNHYTGNNERKAAFDADAKRQADFSNLISTLVLTIDPTNISDFTSRGFAVQDKKLNEIFIILNEELTFIKQLSGTGEVYYSKTVVPITIQNYSNLSSKPYPYPKKNQVWRIITGKNGQPDEIFTIIPTYEDFVNLREYPYTGEYSIRYIRTPQPIITEDLPVLEGKQLTINGKSLQSECELDSIVHEEILQRAVEIAKNVWSGDNASMINLGQRSE